jgi:hypothetical protein
MGATKKTEKQEEVRKGTRGKGKLARYQEGVDDKTIEQEEELWS